MGEIMNQKKAGTAVIFDRDPVSLTALAAVLHSAGYECLCARTEEAVKKAIGQEPIDLLVFDLGKDLPATIRILDTVRGQAGNALPAILLAEPNQAAELETLDLAESTYRLSKPFDPHTLTELARQATWMPHLVSQHRLRGTRPNQPGWISL